MRGEQKIAGVAKKSLEKKALWLCALLTFFLTPARIVHAQDRERSDEIVADGECKILPDELLRFA